MHTNMPSKQHNNRRERTATALPIIIIMLGKFPSVVILFKSAEVPPGPLKYASEGKFSAVEIVFEIVDVFGPIKVNYITF